MVTAGAKARIIQAVPIPAWTLAIGLCSTGTVDYPSPLTTWGLIFVGVAVAAHIRCWLDDQDMRQDEQRELQQQTRSIQNEYIAECIAKFADGPQSPADGTDVVDRTMIRLVR